MIAMLGVLIPLNMAFAQGAAGPTAYVQHVGDAALSVISTKEFTKPQKQEKLEKLFGDNVDFPWVGRFVMGRYWREATPDQRTRYLAAYKKFLLIHYTSRFTDYTGGSFTLVGTKDDGDGEYTVTMQMQANDPGNEPVQVDYRIHKVDGDKEFKIFDVVVEGVGLLSTQRSEFSSVIANKGLDYLINQLAAKSASGTL